MNIQTEKFTPAVSRRGRTDTYIVINVCNINGLMYVQYLLHYCCEGYSLGTSLSRDAVIVRVAILMYYIFYVW